MSFMPGSHTPTINEFCAGQSHSHFLMNSISAGQSKWEGELFDDSAGKDKWEGYMFEDSAGKSKLKVTFLVMVSPEVKPSLTIRKALYFYKAFLSIEIE